MWIQLAAVGGGALLAYLYQDQRLRLEWQRAITDTVLDLDPYAERPIMTQENLVQLAGARRLPEMFEDYVPGFLRDYRGGHAFRAKPFPGRGTAQSLALPHGVYDPRPDDGSMSLHDLS